MQPLHLLGLDEARERLVAGACDSVDLVQACLDRIAAREEQVRAWAWVDAEGALRKARAMAGARPDPRRPLAGLPIAVKDIIDTADMPTAYGSPIYAGHRPAWSAYCVAAIEAAGGIILGKTATSEFAHSAPPATRNPHAPAHTPGGSSGGSAACVADFMAPAALATQTGGSTIRPAAFCGVVGYKPSLGLIDRTGVKPAGVPASTPGSAAPRIGLYRTPHWERIDAPSRDALLARLRRLERHGARVAEVPDLPALHPLYQDQRDIMNHQAARALLHEYRQHREQLSPALRAALEAGQACSPDALRAAWQRTRRARRAYAELWADYDLIVTPAALGAAPAGIASSGDSLLNRNWSLLGVPALSLPNGADPRGLPLAMQLAGSHGGDAALLGWARWIEAAA
ncbi:probable amidase [Bordetella bronchiseptica Bbr77]|nr:probable amidase [Bordetella bronchiseptica Bbr77]